jgi:hypothetical protein
MDKILRKVKYEHRIATANWEAGKNQLESVKLAIAEGRSDVRSPSQITEEMAFWSGRVSILNELISSIEVEIAGLLESLEVK